MSFGRCQECGERGERRFGRHLTSCPWWLISPGDAGGVSRQQLVHVAYVGHPDHDLPHRLVVGEVDADTGHREWEVEHDDCPYSVDTGDPQVFAYRSRWWRCTVGEMVADGDYVFGGHEAIDQLMPGSYEIVPWFSYQPSTPNGPEEWDSGIDIVDPVKAAEGV